MKSSEGQAQQLPKHASRAKWEELGFETVGPAQSTVGDHGHHVGTGIHLWSLANVRRKTR